MKNSGWLLIVVLLSFAACTTQIEETPVSEIELAASTIIPTDTPYTRQTSTPTVTTETVIPHVATVYAHRTEAASHGYTATPTKTMRPTSETVITPTRFTPLCVQSDSSAVSEDEVDALKFMSSDYLEYWGEKNRIVFSGNGYRSVYLQDNQIILYEHVSDSLMGMWENRFSFGIGIGYPYENLSNYLVDLEAAINESSYPEWAVYAEYDDPSFENPKQREFHYDPQYINYEIVYFEEQLSGIKFFLEKDDMVIGDGYIDIETRLSEEINCTKFVLENGYTIPFCTEPGILVSVENLCYLENTRSCVREDLLNTTDTIWWEDAEFKYFPDLISIVKGQAGVDGMVIYSPPGDQLRLVIDCDPSEEYSHTWYYGTTPVQKDEFMMLTSDIAVQEKPCYLTDSAETVSRDRFFEVEQSWRKVILGERAEALFEEMEASDQQ